MGKVKNSRKRKQRRRRTIKKAIIKHNFVGGSNITIFSKDELKGTDDETKLKNLLKFANSNVFKLDDQGETKSKELVPLIIGKDMINNVSLENIAS